MKGKVEKEKFHLIQQLKRVKYGMERDNVCLKTDEWLRLPMLSGNIFTFYKENKVPLAGGQENTF